MMEWQVRYETYMFNLNAHDVNSVQCQLLGNQFVKRLGKSESAQPYQYGDLPQTDHAQERRIATLFDQFSSRLT